MQIAKHQISFLSEDLTLSGWLYSPLPLNEYYGVLFIHGGGKYTESRYLNWQEYLAQMGYSSLSFFSRGVGSSEGNFLDGSLNNRLKDAQNALDYFRRSGVVDPSVVALSGSSMGAHVALRLAERNPKIKTIILQSGAAYCQEAEDKPFTAEFTQTISQPNSWQHSPVFSFLAKFKGHLGVFYGEKDKVIPEEVKARYKEFVKEGQFLEIKNGAHKLLAPETELERQAETELYRASVEFLNKNLT